MLRLLGLALRDGTLAGEECVTMSVDVPPQGEGKSNPLMTLDHS
jgi:hypothetical protein